ncbi:MAG TPA: TspO/MBR family protein [Gammaproteobacteria bacterium]|nr:TspO/MBR family protein [Gammaproteobacteria bacterium]
MPSLSDNRRLQLLRDLPGLIPFLALTALAAASGILTPPGAWYQTLAKPPGTPPGIVFPVVWTLLYVLIAVAAWQVWRRAGLRGGLPALVPFVGQLGANGLWSLLFFGLHSPALGLLDILLLAVLIVLCITRFHRVSPPAAWMLTPYLAWVCYAAYLNAGIVFLNGG